MLAFVPCGQMQRCISEIVGTIENRRSGHARYDVIDHFFRTVFEVTDSLNTQNEDNERHLCSFAPFGESGKISKLL